MEWVHVNFQPLDQYFWQNSPKLVAIASWTSSNALSTNCVQLSSFINLNPQGLWREAELLLKPNSNPPILSGRSRIRDPEEGNQINMIANIFHRCKLAALYLPLVVFVSATLEFWHKEWLLRLETLQTYGQSDRQRQTREFYIVMSGQFCTLAMF